MLRSGGVYDTGGTPDRGHEASSGVEHGLILHRVETVAECSEYSFNACERLSSQGAADEAGIDWT